MYYVSRAGYKKMYEDYLAYGEEIKRVNREVGESAARDRDLRENPEFMSLRVKAMYELPSQREVLYRKYQEAVIIEDTDSYKNFDGKTVIVGSIVDLDFDDEPCTYTILGDDEGDIDNDILSCNAPIAQALIGKKVGDKLEWQGESIKILKVSRI